MSVTQQLLDLFKVDKQLRGLRSRLDTAERFLVAQQKQLSEMETLRASLESQLKQLKASVGGNEGEAARLQARIDTLREQMNSAKTAKEYTAFLNELNTFKEQKSQYEERGLESLTKLDEIEKTLATINAQWGERSGIVTQAKADRDHREAEIKDRVAELQKQREQVASAVPVRERVMLESLIKSRGDDAMVAIEVIDRRAHEYNCSACMMAITVEVVSAVMSGRVAHCPSCHCLLFADPDMLEAEQPKPKAKKPKAPKKVKGDSAAPVAKDEPSAAEVPAT